MQQVSHARETADNPPAPRIGSLENDGRKGRSGRPARGMNAVKLLDTQAKFRSDNQ